MWKCDPLNITKLKCISKSDDRAYSDVLEASLDTLRVVVIAQQQFLNDSQMEIHFFTSGSYKQTFAKLQRNFSVVK